MIPALATMVAFYIVTRMVELIAGEIDKKHTNTGLVISATLTIVVVVICLIIVWVNERQAAEALSETERMLERLGAPRR